MVNILVVEDDTSLNRTICTYLVNLGFNATSCFNANDAYNELYANIYELVISDIMMPGIDGYEFAETLRKVNSNIPILFISALDDMGSKRRSYDVGIDDYMVKPLNLEELYLRVTALLRRSNTATDRKLKIGNVVLDADAYTCTVDGENIDLTTREFNILYKLCLYPNKTFSRSQLMDEFWGLESDTSLRAVDVYITKLRAKLDSSNGFDIVTVRGIGYKVVLLNG